MGEVVVHPRVAERHPEIGDEDVLAAWRNRVCSMPRDGTAKGQVVAIGVDGRGRMLEMVATTRDGDYLVYHALTPPTKKVLGELGLKRRACRWTARR